MRILAVLGAVNGFIAVAAGAFAAHGLEGRVPARQLEVFNTAAHYHLAHALALFAAAWLASRGAAAAHAAGWAFVAGIVVFSGSLYALGLTGIGALGMITPVGGLAMLTGWALLAYAASRF